MALPKPEPVPLLAMIEPPPCGTLTSLGFWVVKGFKLSGAAASLPSFTGVIASGARAIASGAASIGGTSSCAGEIGSSSFAISGTFSASGWGTSTTISMVSSVSVLAVFHRLDTGVIIAAT